MAFRDEDPAPADLLDLVPPFREDFGVSAGISFPPAGIANKPKPDRQNAAWAGLGNQ